MTDTVSLPTVDGSEAPKPRGPLFYFMCFLFFVIIILVVALFTMYIIFGVDGTHERIKKLFSKESSKSPHSNKTKKHDNSGEKSECLVDKQCDAVTCGSDKHSQQPRKPGDCCGSCDITLSDGGRVIKGKCQEGRLNYLGHCVNNNLPPIDPLSYSEPQNDSNGDYRPTNLLWGPYGPDKEGSVHDPSKNVAADDHFTLRGNPYAAAAGGNMPELVDYSDDASTHDRINQANGTPLITCSRGNSGTNNDMYQSTRSSVDMNNAAGTINDESTVQAYDSKYPAVTNQYCQQLLCGGAQNFQGCCATATNGMCVQGAVQDNGSCQTHVSQALYEGYGTEMPNTFVISTAGSKIGATMGSCVVRPVISSLTNTVGIF